MEASQIVSKEGILNLEKKGTKDQYQVRQFCHVQTLVLEHSSVWAAFTGSMDVLVLGPSIMQAESCGQILTKNPECIVNITN
jgi:hypothetical protein